MVAASITMGRKMHQANIDGAKRRGRPATGRKKNIRVAVYMEPADHAKVLALADMQGVTVPELLRRLGVAAAGN